MASAYAISGAVVIAEASNGRVVIAAQPWMLESPFNTVAVLENIEREGFRVVLTTERFWVIEPVQAPNV